MAFKPFWCDSVIERRVAKDPKVYGSLTPLVERMVNGINIYQRNRVCIQNV